MSLRNYVKYKRKVLTLLSLFLGACSPLMPSVSKSVSVTSSAATIDSGVINSQSELVNEILLQETSVESNFENLLNAAVASGGKELELSSAGISELINNGTTQIEIDLDAAQVNSALAFSNQDRFIKLLLIKTTDGTAYQYTLKTESVLDPETKINKLSIFLQSLVR